MNDSKTCLQPSQIESLLHGSLTPDEASAVESHLASCQQCADAVQIKIGPEQWWDDVARSLNSRRDTLMTSASEKESAHRSATVATLLDLLGPTDDPQMLGRIGPYEICGLLGQGGMGAVFKAFDRSLNRFVAIKMLLPHLATSGAARRRFAREGQAVAAVVDDHVMAVHAVDQWNDIPYLVMTYSRGVSLQKRLSHDGPLDVKEILRIGMQTARGLAAAHAQGIVHRDVKPANIFLSESVERVQLMDFGLARAVDDASLTRSGMLAGTPQYMSPEQARAESVDHRSDLFSLGSVMYAMCVGHPPFRGESSYSVLSLIADKEPTAIREINPDIPEWLDSIISKLMSKNPNDRYQSADEVSGLLEECLAHVQQPTTTPLPPSLQVSDSNRRPPIRKLFAAAAFGFGFFLAGVILILELNKGTLHIECEADNVPIRIMRGNEIAKQLTMTKEGKSIRIAAGEYVVKVDGQVEVGVVDGLVKLNRGEDVTVKIVIKPPSNMTVEATPGVEAGNDLKSALVLLMHPAELRGGNSMQQAAASVALGQLRHTDYCGILRYTSQGTQWLWGDSQGLVQIGENRADLLKAITGSTTGDTPQFDEALQKALSALNDVDEAHRHMIILTDGDPSLNDRTLLEKFSDAGITISVVHVELHGPKYEAIPKLIAKATGGRYYHVVDAKSSDLEKIFLRETKLLLAESGQETVSNPSVGEPMFASDTDKAPRDVVSAYIAAVKKRDVPAAQSLSRFNPADAGFIGWFNNRIADLAVESMHLDGRSSPQVALALSQPVERDPTADSPIVRFAFVVEKFRGKWTITWVEPWDADKVESGINWFRSSVVRYDARVTAKPKPKVAPDLIGIWRAVSERRGSNVPSARHRSDVAGVRCRPNQALYVVSRQRQGSGGIVPPDKVGRPENQANDEGGG